MALPPISQQKLARLLAQVPTDRAEMLRHMGGYAETDLLCYRAPSNDALAARQSALFDPILHWAQENYGIALNVTDSVMPIAQPHASLEKIASLFSAANDRELAALSLLVPILGSAVLALAVWKRHRSIEAALAAARLDEMMQAEQYGEDAEEAAKWALKCADARACDLWLTENALK